MDEKANLLPPFILYKKRRKEGMGKKLEAI
jgi:hypothetical protein